MVPRSSFFVASLWAPLPMVGMLACVCLWVMAFPGTIGLAEGGRDAASVVLIATPVFYTAIFGAIYFTARALHAINALSVWALIAVGAFVALVVGGLVAAWGYEYEERRLLILAAAVFVSGFVGLTITALVWWRVAIKTPPVVPLYEKQSSRSRRRRERDVPTAVVTVEPVPAGGREVVSDELIIRWDSRVRRLQIVHPDRTRHPVPLAEIDEKALTGAAAEDARLIGEPFTRLMPGLRSRYADSADPEPNA